MLATPCFSRILRPGITVLFRNPKNVSDDLIDKGGFFHFYNILFIKVSSPQEDSVLQPFIPENVRPQTSKSKE
jgi:hypothetical protein